MWMLAWCVCAVIIVACVSSHNTTLDPYTRPYTSNHDSNRLAKLHRLIRRGCRRIVIVTGPELSELAGVPTYRNPNKDIATNFRACFHPIFREDDQCGDVSPRFRFLNNIRTIAAGAMPSRAHFALAAFERVMSRRGKNATIITENLDELHQRAGSKAVVECHGSMWKLRCSYCGHEKADYNIPLTPALDPHGAPTLEDVYYKPPIDEKHLPRCEYYQKRFNHTCMELCAPFAYVTMLGITYRPTISAAEELIEETDMIFFIGTSDDEFKPLLPWGKKLFLKGVPIVEIREKPWPNDLTYPYRFHYHGDLNFWVPKVLNISQKQIEEEMELTMGGKLVVTPSLRTTGGIDWEFLFRNSSYLPDDVVRQFMANKTKPEHFFDDFSAIKTRNETEESMSDPRLRDDPYSGIL